MTQEGEIEKEQKNEASEAPDATVGSSSAVVNASLENAAIMQVRIFLCIWT